MDKQELQAISFQLVACVGEASAHFTQAIECARNACFEDANRKLDEANACIVRAHETQTAILRAEVAGDEMEFSLLMMHAQDHLMTTITFGRVAEEFVKLYKEVRDGN